MIAITNKTSRTALINEITALNDSIDVQRLHLDALRISQREAVVRAEHAERTISVLETDVHNLLGTIRVMADSSREVRIRKSSVRDADFALALPTRNTDKL